MSKGNVEDRDASHTVESPYCGKHPIWVIRDNLAVSNLGRDSQQLRLRLFGGTHLSFFGGTCLSGPPCTVR